MKTSRQESISFVTAAELSVGITILAILWVIGLALFLFIGNPFGRSSANAESADVTWDSFSVQAGHFPES